MSLFQNWVICADCFGDELPLPLPAVKIMQQNKKTKNVDSTATTAAKILNTGAATDNVVSESKDYRKNTALALTPTFDGLFHFETMERKKKNVNSTDITANKTLNVGAATNNAVGESKKDYRKNTALALTPTFDGLFHFETMERKKKNVNSTDITANKTLNVGAATNNAVGESKKRELTFAPTFDGLHPFETFVSR